MKNYSIWPTVQEGRLTHSNHLRQQVVHDYWVLGFGISVKLNFKELGFTGRQIFSLSIHGEKYIHKFGLNQTLIF